MKILSAADLKKAMKDPLVGAIFAHRQTWVNAFWDYWSRPNKNGDVGFTITAKSDEPTTALHAFNQARSNHSSFVVESTTFALLGWKSPESGKTSGPYIVTVFMAAAIEIGENGRFKDVFPASQEGYFPWTDKEKS